MGIFRAYQIRLWLVCIVFSGMFAFSTHAMQTDPIDETTMVELCPAGGIQQRGAEFAPGGIILTYFDRFNLWVYNVDRNTRYPLPDTAPCGTNCHLSEDARWITYLDAPTRIFGKMRLDGTQRTPLASYATEVSWWSADTLLVWTPTYDAYLRPETGTQDEIEILDVASVVNVQPGGRWGLLLARDEAEEAFTRVLVNLETRELEWRMDDHVVLGLDAPYYNASSWSPDGATLAYVAQAEFDANAGAYGGEIFAIQPGDAEPTQVTQLFERYGAVRINGHAPADLSWSPDGTRIAFWVTERFGANPEGRLGSAVIHILDVATGEIIIYCGFATNDHTPNTPRLVWSPDSTHMVFGANVPADERGYLLLALDTASGFFTELSSGIYPAMGRADVVAWGLPPQ